MDRPETALRTEVGMLRRRFHGRRFHLAVHVGVLGTGATGHEIASPGLLDVQLRTDLLLRLVAQATTDPVDAWLTRSGGVEIQDQDLAWLSAALLGTGCLGAGLRSFHTVTRAGWLDPRTGHTRVWKRLRL